MTAAQAVLDYITFKQSLGSRFHAEATILKAFCNALGDIALVDVQPHQVTRYLAGSGSVTRFWHRKYEALSGFYRFALARGYVTCSPLPTTIPKRPLPFQPFIYSREQLRDLLRRARRMRHRGPRWKRRRCVRWCCCCTGRGCASAKRWR